jgi:nicotinate-nucleotide adenylyltransferase
MGVGRMEEDKKKSSPILPFSLSPLLRVAVYGGTFDPVHNGHLSIAHCVSELFDIDEILFMPAFVAPHKRDVKSSSAWHRYAMLALATQNESKFRLSTIELDAPEKPFTIQTLSRLQEMFGDGVKLFFIMGADSWMDIRTWHDWENLLLMTNHIVVTRPSYELETSHITQEARERIVDVRVKETKDVHEILKQENESKIYVTDAVQMDVSASKIRQDVRDGKENWTNDVPVSVAEYIKKYQLYRSD